MDSHWDDRVYPFKIGDHLTEHFSIVKNLTAAKNTARIKNLFVIGLYFLHCSLRKSWIKETFSYVTSTSAQNI